MKRGWLGVAVLSIACAGQAPASDKPAPLLERQPVQWFGSKVTIVFPTKAELKAVGATPVAGMLGTPSQRVNEYTLSAEDDVSGTDDETAKRWSGLLAGRTDAELTPELGCVARHVARFVSTHGGPPEAELRQFIASRCKSTALSIGVLAYSGYFSPTESDDEIAARWTAKAMAGLPKEFDVAGVTFSRPKPGRQAKASLLVVTGQTMVDELLPSADSAGRVLIEGRVKTAVTRLVVVSADSAGVQECSLGASIQLPRFSAQCGKPRIAIVAFDESGGLGTPVLQWSGATTSTYRAVRSGDGDLHAQINRKRTAAGLFPLLKAQEQSAETKRLAPSFFAAKARTDRAMVETIAKGLMAGWDVQAPVTAGWFLSAATSAGADPKTLFESMWADPLVARQLLRPELRRLAIGSVSESGSVGAVVVGYETVEPGERESLTTQVFEALSAKRMELGKERPVAWRDVAAVLGESASQIEGGNASAGAGMERAIRVASKETGEGAVGHLVVPTKLSEIRFPAALLDPVQIKVGLAVAIEKIAGQPWSKPIVLVLVSQGP